MRPEPSQLGHRMLTHGRTVDSRALGEKPDQVPEPEHFGHLTPHLARIHSNSLMPTTIEGEPHGRVG
jgi:hypothetical protein